MTPERPPSTDTHTSAMPASAGRSGSMPTNEALPTRVRLPFTSASTPSPYASWNSSAVSRLRPRAAASERIAAASGCADCCSAAAATASTSSLASATRGWPVVSVPVLSKTTTVAEPICSRGVPPLTTIPRRAARARPETKAIGVARIRGHGVATTRTARAATGEPEIAQPSAATASVMGRNTTAARSARRAVRGLSASARSTRRTMRAYVDTAAGRTARTSIASPTTLAPLRISSPCSRRTGRGSPVSAASSSTARGLSSVQSTGTISPARIRRASPATTCAAGTSATVSPLRRWATAGARAASAASSLRARRKARSSSNSPPESISATTRPASSSPSSSAPTIARSAMTSAPSWPCRIRRPTDSASGPITAIKATLHTTSAACGSPASLSTRPATSASATAPGTRRLLTSPSWTRGETRRISGFPAARG